MLRCRLARAVALAALMPLAAGAYVGTFDPDEDAEAGTPQLVTFVDSNAAPVLCVEMAGRSGDVGLAAAGLIAPIAACSSWTHDGRSCRIVAPISPGVGQAVAMATLLAGPDALLGHEFRHCMDHDFHPPLVAFVESKK